MGMMADVTVFGQDPMAVPAAQIPDIPVVATVVGGRVVYAAPGGALDVPPAVEETPLGHLGDGALLVQGGTRSGTVDS